MIFFKLGKVNVLGKLKNRYIELAVKSGVNAGPSVKVGTGTNRPK